MHKFIVPTGKLSYLVKRIYEIDIPQPSTFEENQIIPLGTGTITFLAKGDPRYKTINGIQYGPDCILSGQYFPTFSFACDTPLLFYGIALKPMATYKLFDIYLATIQNDFISLDEVIGNKATQVHQKLLQVNATDNRLNLLQEFMTQMLPDTPIYSHLDKIIDYIYKKQGILKVKNLYDHEGVSRRYLEKKFKKFIGFTPGQFIRQVRFNFTCSKIAEGDMSVNDILTKFGYYDRSHFMKKFKKYHSGDLSVLTGDGHSLFKSVFSRIMRSDTENRYHP